ncbi:MAG: hypothetical protein V7K38_26175 [Nostoc sp.]|uniref:hypothetical protein n=1 Tax=Nostoc sp. TaxID=1180 RepID=UPI002FFBD928
MPNIYGSVKAKTLVPKSIFERSRSVPEALPPRCRERREKKEMLNLTVLQCPMPNNQ